MVLKPERGHEEGMTELGEPRQGRLLPYRRVGPVGNPIEVYAATRLARGRA